jgi:hypothetical protein
MLHQIYNLSLAINSAIPGAVHSYRDGDVHVLTTPRLTFPVAAACIALRVEVTDGLPVSRAYGSNPTYYFDVGHVTPNSNSAPMHGERIVYAKQLMILPAATDSISVETASAVRLRITELLRST